jgi:hypothetical protein
MSELNLKTREAGRCQECFASFSYLLELFVRLIAHTPALAQKSPVARAILGL